MSPRVTSGLLLVGSVPATSAEGALRAAAVNFAAPGLVFALPDGETGPRSSWVGYERERLVRPNPDIETVSETSSPTFAADYPVAARGYADLVAREIDRLTAAVPPEDLAIQWDIAYETLDIEGVLSWSSGGAWDRYADAVDRLPRLVPGEVLTGFHLCYGTFPEWPMYEARAARTRASSAR